jgi:hypothetical protein
MQRVLEYTLHQLQKIETEKFYNRVSGEEYTMFYNVNFKSNNTINLFECGIHYVDETVQPFNKRTNGHMSDIKYMP